MTSVIGTAVARAPRNVRVNNKNPQIASMSKKELNPGTFQSVSEMVGFMEKFLELVQSNEKDNKELMQTAVLTLCSNLKVYGYQLETSFKDQLDRVFIHLRNAGRDESFDKISRLHLLEVVELRAGRWIAQDEISSYYKLKLAELSATGGEIDQLGPNMQQFPQQQTGLYADRTEGNTSPPPMLLPGETVKFSGKYTTAQQQVNKAPSSTSSNSANSNKNFIKDEVVIRNADSGKVNPGAKERLVQITGPGQDNIERARQLIEQTIQRNASPVRDCNAGDTSVSSGISPGQMADDDPVGFIKSLQQQQQCRQSMVDAALDDYQYTVTVGQNSIKITGQNLELVQVAKLVLDEYFATTGDGRQRTVSISSSIDDGVGMSYPSSQQESPRDSSGVPSSINSATKKVSLGAVPKYNRESLVLWSSSPLCLQPPSNFHLLQQFAPEILRKVKGPAAQILVPMK